jgi:hypothetical protein
LSLLSFLNAPHATTESKEAKIQYQLFVFMVCPFSFVAAIAAITVTVTVTVAAAEKNSAATRAQPDMHVCPEMIRLPKNRVRAWMAQGQFGTTHNVWSPNEELPKTTAVV